MLEASCHCGAVHLTIPRKPRSLTNCNCSICRRYGVLWAYVRAEQVQITAAPGATASYRWGRKAQDFVRCATCGCIMLWQRIQPRKENYMGINARNFDLDALGDVRIRWLDGAGSWKYLD